MYVTTFYSFKGGVGRTMALVNAAVELANTGRRVLVVDFDLEAPGLDTFDFLRTDARAPGIIDFVGEYLASGQAPEVSGFIRQPPAIGDGGGGLWIMPSGAQQETYAAKFSQVDWGALYEEHDGYLLFEDLKEQWKRILKPDYVLIDSRTGHTDTGGICTRQLPDAVAIFFFPNEQNLRGLTKVVRDIRSEASEPRNKIIELHFVMSNVPDLDDEDRILQNKIDAFQHQLGFTREPAVVHRYDSLSLLNQVIFTNARPKSRLAGEYRAVVQQIVRRNLADREGALSYIRRAGMRRRRRETDYESPLKMDQQLRHIEEMYSGDGEVLFRLAESRRDDRGLAASLLNQAIEAGYDEPEAFLARAHLRADNDDLADASADALRVLQSDDLPPPLVRQAVILTKDIDPGHVAMSQAVATLTIDDRIWLAGSLSGSETTLGVVVAILNPIVGDNSVAEEERAPARSVLALALMEMREFARATKALRNKGRAVDQMNRQDAFNYGMALWGETGDLVAPPFARAVTLDREDFGRDDPNYLQCMAVAYWAAGNTAAAIDCVRLARKAADATRGSTFSCWRYRNVGASVFKSDLDEILALIEGDTSITPQFMTTTASDERHSG